MVARAKRLPIPPIPSLLMLPLASDCMFGGRREEQEYIMGVSTNWSNHNQFGHCVRVRPPDEDARRCWFSLLMQLEQHDVSSEAPDEPL